MIRHIDQRPAHINMLYQPQRILSDVRKFMGEEDIVISDGGRPQDVDCKGIQLL